MEFLLFEVELHTQNIRSFLARLAYISGSSQRWLQAVFGEHDLVHPAKQIHCWESSLVTFHYRYKTHKKLQVQ